MSSCPASSSLPLPSGYVGADLTALCKEAAAIAVTRIFSTLGRVGEAAATAAAAVVAVAAAVVAVAAASVTLTEEGGSAAATGAGEGAGAQQGSGEAPLQQGSGEAPLQQLASVSHHDHVMMDAEAPFEIANSRSVLKPPFS